MKDIKKLIEEIKESNHRWKALYMSTWALAYHLRDTYKNKRVWVKPIKLGLPASILGYEVYTPDELHHIATHRDGEIALNHTITILSLLEILAKKTHKHLHPTLDKPFLAYKKSSLIGFLKENNFLHDQEENEFNLFIETRNCVTHNHHKVDEKWLEKYEKARNCKPSCKIDDELYSIVPLPQIEKWHDLVLNIVTRIEDSLEKIKTKN